jgi:hypothetical protein
MEQLPDDPPETTTCWRCCQPRGGMNTRWYLHSQRTRDKLSKSCMMLSLLPARGFPEGSYFRRIGRASSGRKARGRGFSPH